jgi:hypothetical protein
MLVKQKGLTSVRQAFLLFNIKTGVRVEYNTLSL